MRNLKRFLAMTLTMLMVVGCFAMTSSAKFDDVTDFQNEITILSNLGVIKGNADGTFGFDQSVTRRQEALFIARASTGKVTDTVWAGTINNTNFTDLDATGDYYGAISYCANLGVIKGRTSTAFYPNDNIIFQEAVAMVVRALGYGSATMDAGYPYTYYDKAVSLGLDKGLENVALTDVVSRGVAAKLLYNTLFAINSDGVTMASSSFGAVVKSTNVVLVATDGKKLVTNYSLPTAAGTAAFCEFNNDGTLNLDKVYNLNWSDFSKLAFGADSTKKAADYVGASFAVTTVDGFKTLTSVTENPSKTFTQADATGNGTIAGTAYTLVEKWSSVFNTGTTFSGKNELLQFNTAYTKGGISGKTAFYGNHWYVVDDSNNILDTNGSPLLYYRPGTSGNLVFPYCYKLTVGTTDSYYPAYLPVDGSAYAGAATVDQLGAKVTYATNRNDAKYTTNVSAYADTVAYDDNNDGTYDRAYFTNYTFGQFFTFSKDGHTYYNVTLGAKGNRISTDNDIDGAKRGFKDITLVNISGKDVKDSDYVLWARDIVNNSLIIKKVFGADNIKTGYVTGVNVFDKTITVINNLFNYGLGIGTGDVVKYGVAKLPGATNTNDDLTINDDGTGKNLTETLIGINYSLQYKSISYIVDDAHDNKIIAIIGEQTADTPLVIYSVDSTYNALGYVRANVIDNSGTMQAINISRINNIPVLNWYANASLLTAGQIIYGAKQNDGTWIIDTASVSNIRRTFNTASSTNDDVLTFKNGYAYENLGPAGVTRYLTPDLNFKADGSKLVIIVASVTTVDGVIKNTTYQIANGIPSKDINGADPVLTIKNGSVVYAKDGYMFVYPAVPTTGSTTVAGATFTSGYWNLTNGWQVGATSDIIRLTNLGLISATNGYTYQGTYFSVITGESNNNIGAYITSNGILEAGKFYNVTKVMSNGTTMINVIGDAIPLSTVYIKSFGDTFAITAKADGTADTPITGEIKVYDWTGATKDISDPLKIPATVQPAAGTYYEALTYTGTGAGINATKRYIFVTNKLVTLPLTGSYTVALSAPAGNFFTANASTADDAIVANYVGTNKTVTPNVPVDLTAITGADAKALVTVHVYNKTTGAVINTDYVSAAFTNNTVTVTGLQSITTYGSTTVKSDLTTGDYVIEVTLSYQGATSTYGAAVHIA